MEYRRSDQQGDAVLIRHLQAVCRTLTSTWVSDAERLLLVRVPAPFIREEHAGIEIVMSNEEEGEKMLRDVGN